MAPGQAFAPPSFSYTRIPTSQHDEEKEPSVSSPQRSSVQPRLIFALFYIILGIAVGFALGYYVGDHNAQRLARTGLTTSGLLQPPGTVGEGWYHDMRYTGPPTTESEDLWEALMPAGRGFVHHPDIAPSINGVAVFHQIHCLHAILIAYWTAMSDLESALNDTHFSQRPQSISPERDQSEHEPQTGVRIAPHHVRHCFDYLRRAIICAADTNLEWVNGTEHASDGWWSPRTCRDWGQVFAWTGRWRESDDVGIVADLEFSKVQASTGGG
ncbi:hypothetical protein MMC10_003558 [Thelotrema lepadinum]|nr:hypothetical protein [Thelotrema lepadinum]